MTKGDIGARLAVITAVVLVSSRASADPIHALFRVHVVSRTTNPLVGPEPFDATFPLTVTFDGTPRAISGDCCRGAVDYGPPTFGNVPLENSGIPPGNLPYDNDGVFGGWFLADDGTFTRHLRDL